jgi:hypothetical protein
MLGKKGGIFEVRGKEFAFLDTTAQGCVRALELGAGRIVRFRKDASERLIRSVIMRMDDNTPIFRRALDVAEEREEKKDFGERAMRTMKNGQRFIGQNNKEYIFRGMKRTRFLCEDALSGQLYTGKPMLIKEVL